MKGSNLLLTTLLLVSAGALANDEATTFGASWGWVKDNAAASWEKVRKATGYGVQDKVPSFRDRISSLRDKIPSLDGIKGKASDLWGKIPAWNDIKTALAYKNLRERACNLPSRVKSFAQDHPYILASIVAATVATAGYTTWKLVNTKKDKAKEATFSVSEKKTPLQI